MTTNPGEWQRRCKDEDSKHFNLLVECIESEMRGITPTEGDLSVFVYNFKAGEALPNERVVRQIRKAYMSSADNVEGWSNVEFHLDPRGGESYITFTV